MLKGMELKQKYTDNTFYVHAQDVTEDGLKKKATTCGRGNTQICIRENGDVAPCIQFNLAYGNLKNQEIYDIFNYSRVSYMIDFKEPSLQTCLDCSQAYNCGGCVAMAYDIPAELCKWKRENPEVIEQFKKISIKR